MTQNEIKFFNYKLNSFKTNVSFILDLYKTKKFKMIDFSILALYKSELKKKNKVRLTNIAYLKIINIDYKKELEKLRQQKIDYMKDFIEYINKLLKIIKIIKCNYVGIGDRMLLCKNGINRMYNLLYNKIKVNNKNNNDKVFIPNNVLINVLSFLTKYKYIKTIVINNRNIKWI